MALIYMATTPCGKSYVGVTVKTLRNRISGHYHYAYKRNSHLAFHRALRKYGKDNIKWEVLAFYPSVASGSVSLAAASTE